jgi:16S rRNA (cytosine1402-N4)-methyltransferase
MTASNQQRDQDPDEPPVYHVPVLRDEVVDGLVTNPSGTYVDCTFGGGGHSRAMLARLDKDARLFVFDQDDDARRNLPDDHRVEFIPQNFRHIGRFLKLHKVQAVDGILADLGVSSHQFDEPERGFSTRFDAPLDMRMDIRQERTAATLLQEMSEPELHKLFEQYGEVTNARTLARHIATYRQSAPLQTISQFKSALQPVVKGNPHKYFAQVFQALRIAVNDELGALKELLEQTPSLLRPGGRVAIITFHSLEDRLVKIFFREGGFNGSVPDEVYGTRPESPFSLVTRKPILPGADELRRNPRSRSAKLRIAERRPAPDTDQKKDKR